MLRTRVMPCLLLQGESLVKTVKFKKLNYIGDAINTVRIFNQMEVDELIFLDIQATVERRKPPFEIIQDIASECFMPFAYGGGIRDLDDIKRIFSIGVEKIVINSYAYEHPEFITLAADKFGSQSIIVSIDSKKNFWGKYEVFTQRGRKKTKMSPIEYAQKMERLGAGEIFINSIEKDGTWDGYDITLIQDVSAAVKIPVIACGGAGSIADLGKAVKEGGASAVAAGSLFVYQAKDLGVLINFPEQAELQKAID